MLAHIHSERPANSEPKPNAVYTKSSVCILHVLSLTGSRSSCLRMKTFMLGGLPSMALSYEVSHEDSPSSDRILGHQLVWPPGVHHCSLLNSPLRSLLCETLPPAHTQPWPSWFYLYLCLYLHTASFCFLIRISSKCPWEACVSVAYLISDLFFL